MMIIKHKGVMYEMDDEMEKLLDSLHAVMCSWHEGKLTEDHAADQAVALSVGTSYTHDQIARAYTVYCSAGNVDAPWIKTDEAVH